MALAGAIAFGFLGFIHPAFDSFSHFRIHLAVLTALAVLPLALLRYWPEAVFAAALSGATVMATIAPPWTQESRTAHFTEATAASTPIYRLMQLNLRFDNGEPQRVLSTIGTFRPDVITLNEVSEPWRERLALLEPAYPFQVVCPPPSAIGGVAILSRRPFLSNPSTACGERGSFARVTVDFGGQAVDVAAMHLGWPWPFGQPWHLSRVEDELTTIGDTAILAGDFNAVPWSWTVRRVEEIGGFRAIRGIGPTWLDRRLPAGWRTWIGLPIDQVLVKGAIVAGPARTLPAAGSDHLPVLLTFSVRPAQEPAVEFARR